VLRRQVGRVRYQPGDRLWLAALSRLIPRHRWGEAFAVTRRRCSPGTGGSSHAKWDYTSKRRPGRPSTAAAIRSSWSASPRTIPRGAPARARRAHQARPPDRGVHSVADPA
jgi:hypothetical protein